MSTLDVRDAVGVDPSALRKLERGIMRNPSIATLLLLAEAYDVTLDELVYGEPKEGLLALGDIDGSGAIDA
jgi:transcriptional regulator with XRE-family HTH domain